MKFLKKKKIARLFERRLIAIFLIAIINFGLFYGIIQSGFLYSWNYRLTDNLYTSENQTSKDILIVAIDEKSLQGKEEGGLGRWQEWTRDFHAQTLKNLQNAGAIAIGVDVLFLDDSQNRAADDQLAEVVKNSDNIILASKYDFDHNNFILPRENFFGNDWSKIAPINVPIDPDNIARRMFVFIEHTGRIFESFDVSLAKKFLDEPNESKDAAPMEGNRYMVTQNRIRLPFDLSRSFAPIKVPLADHGSMYVNFFGPPFSFSRLSFVDVYNNNFDPGMVKNKIVLIGEMGATGLHDVEYTPVSRGVEMPGVEIHANTIQTLLSGRFLEPQNPNKQLLSIAIVILCSTALFIFAPIWVSSIVLILGTFLFIVSSILAFENGILVSMFYIPLSYLLTYIISIIYKYVVESSRKRYIKQAFSRYVSSALVDQIMKDPEILKLGGSRKEITILFSDIQGFTSLSEKMPPEELVSMLNQYLTQMTNIVFEQGGTLDKYVGDAIMAFWGAPLEDLDHAYHACVTALTMQREMEKIRARFREELNIELFMRVGLNTGEVIVGNVGSHIRFNYTVIGDHVNLASRLEGVNKQYHTYIMASENTYEKTKDRFEFRKLDIIRVKGKREPVAIFELLCEKGKLSDKERKKLDLFQKGFNLYHEQKWDLARAVFQEILTGYPEDGPSKTYIERCEYFNKNPLGADWDGVFEMKTK